MRAISLRGAVMFRRSALANISVARVWCSTEATKEEPSFKAKEAAGGATGAKKEATPVTPEAFAKLEKTHLKAKEEIEELKKEILYRAADAENARRIGREDVEKARSYGITSFSKDMLEVVDTLEKGIEAIGKIPEAELQSNKNLSAIHTGVKLSLKVLLNNLAKHGIEKCDVTIGDKFDPNVHDALMKTPPTEKVPKEHISHILKTGYKIKGRVLRAPQVGVSDE